MKKIFHSMTYVTFITIFLFAPQVLAGGTLKIDDTKSWNIGAGMRASYAALEDGAPNGTNSVSYTHLTLPTILLV